MALPIAALTDIALAAAQIYFIAKREEGKTADEAKADFLLLHDKFMEASAKPVDEVKE